MSGEVGEGGGEGKLPSVDHNTLNEVGRDKNKVQAPIIAICTASEKQPYGGKWVSGYDPKKMEDKLWPTEVCSAVARTTLASIDFIPDSKASIYKVLMHVENCHLL